MAGSSILDLCSLSFTFPKLPDYLIPRDLYLDNFEMELEHHDVLFVRGQREGCGVTTALAMFALRHSLSCISYFNDGLNLYLTEADEISNSLAQQLYFYNIGEKYPGEILDIESQLLPLAKTIRKRNQVLYFVFDGFDHLPQEKFENIKMLMSKLFSCGAVKFIFSGSKDDFNDLLADTIQSKSELGLIFPFGEHEVKGYFEHMSPKISSEDTYSLFKFSEGLATKMDYISTYYRENGTYNPFLNSDIKKLEDLYQEDFSSIAYQEDNYKLLALTAFSGIPLKADAVCDILKFSERQFENALNAVKSFLYLSDDGIVLFRSNVGHRFIRKKLSAHEQQIGSLMINFFEHEQSRYLTFIPPLYRKLKRGQLLHFLHSANVQQILIDQQSQAALNVQCNIGYKESTRSRDLPELYMFSLYKSMSKEIERNELWDNEIEALTSVGDFATALSLAESVFLNEEKLKSYAIIARRQKDVKGTIDPIILQKILGLHAIIRYEDIPDKSLELAKLLIPVDYKIALEISDRVVKSDEGKDMNKIMSMMSLSALSGYSKPGDSAASYEMFVSRIDSDEVKSQTEAMKSMFTDLSVDEFINVVKGLPNDFQQLHILQYWISSNRRKPNIFKAVQLGFDLIIKESSKKIPHSALVSRLCDALPYMSYEELNYIVEMVDNIRMDIRYPS